MDCKHRGNTSNLDRYSIISVLGQGSFAKVCLVEEIATKSLYAMKVINKKKIKRAKQREQLFNERFALMVTDHPFITDFKSSFQTENKLYYIIEYCPGKLRSNLGGELFGLLTKKVVLEDT